MGDQDEASQRAGLIVASSEENGHHQLMILNQEILQLDKDIQVTRLVLLELPEDHSGRAEHFHELGIALFKRYVAAGAAEDLAEAVRAQRQAVDSSLIDFPRRPTYLSRLAVSLNEEYFLTGETAMLDEAIIFARKALDTTPTNNPNRATRVGNLGAFLANGYFAELATVDDFEEASQYLQDAIAMAPDDERSQSIRLSGLANGYGEKYLRTGDLVCLNQSIQFGRQFLAVALEDDPDRVSRLNDLADRLHDRYSEGRDAADIDHAIQFKGEVLAATLEGDSNRPTLLSKLGDMYLDRFDGSDTTSDLDEAIRLGEQASEITPKDHPSHLQHIDRFVMALLTRYSVTGMTSDLEQAILFGHGALALTPEDDTKRRVRLDNLGTGIFKRYQMTGALVDLDKAIQLLRESLEGLADDDPSSAWSRVQLGSMVRNRHHRLGELADLDESVEIFKMAIQATPEGDPDRLAFINFLLGALKYQFWERGVTTTLEEAIVLGKQTIAASLEYCTFHNELLITVAGLLDTRFEKEGLISDLDDAINFARKSVSATPEDRVYRADRFIILGNLLYNRWEKTQCTADLDESVSCYESGLYQSTAGTLKRIHAARRIVNLSMDWWRCIKAACCAMGLIRKLTARSLKASDRQYLLAQVAGLASEAAALALEGKQPTLQALYLLEYGRGMFGASFWDLRMEIRELQEKHPLLAKQLIEVRDELQKPQTTNVPFNNEIHERLWSTAGDRYWPAGRSFDDLVVKIRQQPGFEDFLGPPGFEEIQAAAENGPIVVINVCDLGCAALIIEPHRAQTLDLPNLSIEDISMKAWQSDLGSPDILEWLWDTVAGPVLAALGFNHLPSDDNWPHVWWIPTGLLGKFPLHAAGRHDNGTNQTVLDRVISSYSSSIKAIIYGRQGHAQQGASTQALLVAMENTPGNATPLPFATREVALVRNICNSMGLVPVQVEGRKRQIMSNLADCSVFHFAGHGFTDTTDPLKSYLGLEDVHDPLTVVDLFEMNIHQRMPFLAYLSACGTGQIRDEKYIDENIHLISACQLAGFRHVIGTLWEVSDEVCVDIARIIYEGIRDGGLTDEAVYRGLHRAVRTLRDRWLKGTTRTAKGEETSCEEVSRSLVEGPTLGDLSERSSPARLPRKAVVCDDDELGPANWVPYVHFGI